MKFPEFYKSIPKFKIFQSNGVRITPLKFEHRFHILKWRNEQLYHLRQKEKLTKKNQNIYFEKVLKILFEEKEPYQLLFSIFYNEKLIGYGGLVHLNWIDRYCEMSFLVKTSVLEEHQNSNFNLNKKTVYDKVFSEFIKCMREIVFKHLEFNRLFTETYSLRKNHIKVLSKNNFIYEGTQRKKILISGKYYDSLFHSIIKNDEK